MKETPVSTPEATEKPVRVVATEDTHLTFTSKDTGFDVYAPVEGRWGYRYAPSIIYYPDGQMDAWFATPGNLGEWDWFTYKHSNDGGKTWGEEQIVLQPTPDSMDHYSVCDPGVIYFGGYYYIGYTSTIVSTNGGINNNVFVARSKSPTGPYEKWNGSGWGGDPQPIVYYNESDDTWGAGEPAFVELDGTLYIYYTWSCQNGSFKYVSTVDSTNENWPATMQFQGKAFSSDQGDQVDVIYVEELGLFVGFQTTQRFTKQSGIQLWESVDGLKFKKGEIRKENIAQFCHNMGVAKRPDGHISLEDQGMIGYAYASGGNESNFWGKWATRFLFVDWSSYVGDLSKNRGNNLLLTDYYWKAPTNPQPVGISTNPHLVRMTKGTTTSDFKIYWYDSTISAHQVTKASDVTFSDYDKNVIGIKGLNIVAKSTGKTELTITYKGYSVTVKVYVYDKDSDYIKSNPKITSVKAVQPELTISSSRAATGAKHGFQARAYVTFDNDTWGEAYNDKTSNHPNYPAMVPAENYPVTYKSSDTKIAKVSSDGIITGVSVGDAVITGKIGSFTFDINVHVTE